MSCRHLDRALAIAVKIEPTSLRRLVCMVPAEPKSNKYSHGGVAAVCSTCGTDKYSAANSPHCTKCPEGSFRAPNSAEGCFSCPPGYTRCAAKPPGALSFARPIVAWYVAAARCSFRKCFSLLIADCA